MRDRFAEGLIDCQWCAIGAVSIDQRRSGITDGDIVELPDKNPVACILKVFLQRAVERNEAVAKDRGTRS